MRKVLSIWLILLYAVTFIGAGVTINYCCGQFSSMNWFNAADERVGHDQMAALGSEGCCASCTMQFRSVPSTLPSAGPVPEPAPEVPDASSFSVEVIHPVFVFVDPRPRSDGDIGQPPPLFLMNRVFRI